MGPPMGWGNDGVIWFGTSSGVSCYDGKEFTSLTTEDGSGHNCVVAIYGDPDGVIWFGTGDWQSDGGGVSRYDEKTFTDFTTRDGRVRYGLEQEIDPVAGGSRYDGRKFVNYTTQDGLADNRIFAIHRDPDGMMWFGTANGISRYDGKIFVTYTTQDELADNRVFNFGKSASVCCTHSVICCSLADALSFSKRLLTVRLSLGLKEAFHQFGSFRRCNLNQRLDLFLF